MRFRISCIVIMALALGACSNPGLRSQPRILRVSLYPFIPEAEALYWKLASDFESENPEIQLVINQLNQYYYDDRPENKGILFEEADVFELDSVFLTDFIRLSKIQELPIEIKPDEKELLPIAAAASQQDKKWYGSPHWVCGNFLFYRKNDKEIADARTLADIERAIRKNLQNGNRPQPENALLIDLCGTSTLGEMYLDSEMDRHKYIAGLHLNALDPNATRSLERAFAMTSLGTGRNNNYHERLGFYARQFFRRRGRALVGYSETLHYGITETLQSCRNDEPFLSEDEIAVSEWPLADEGSQPIGWVDMFVINASCSGQKLEDAKRFTRYMVSKETYRAALLPNKGSGPRYLLPAYTAFYNDPEVLKNAPLYPKFLPILDKAIPVSTYNLNSTLRKRAKELNEILPKDKTDK